MIMDWPEGRDFWNVTRHELKRPHYIINSQKLEKQHALFTDESFCLVGKQLYGVVYDKSQKLLEENMN